MFTRMLVATDLSEVSDKVICSLGGLKAIGTEEAVLIHCFHIRDVGALAKTLMELSAPSFERQKKMLQDLGYKVTARMVLGLPQMEINRQADQYNCSLIVVGSTGGTMAGEILLGSVASAIIHNATRPVLVLRTKVKQEGGQIICSDVLCSPLEHILFPTDFSDNAEHAFSYVQKMASYGAKKITLLHVQDKARIDRHLKDRLEEFNRIDTERLNRLKDVLVKAGAKDVRIEIPYGSPKKEIISWTESAGVSLVVMGSQGRSYMGEIFLGSVSHAVVRGSGAPVLLIPAVR